MQVACPRGLADVSICDIVINGELSLALMEGQLPNLLIEGRCDLSLWQCLSKMTWGPVARFLGNLRHKNRLTCRNTRLSPVHLYCGEPCVISNTPRIDSEMCGAS